MEKFQDSGNSQGIRGEWRKRGRGREERGVTTTGHFTRLMGWESLAAGAGRKGFTVGFREQRGYYQFIFLYRR